MDVKRVMKHQVRTCRPDDVLNTAAQIMWEEACGSVPVVDADSRPVGFLSATFASRPTRKVGRSENSQSRARWPDTLFHAGRGRSDPGGAIDA